MSNALATTSGNWRTPIDFEGGWRLARALSSSALVPAHLRDKSDPNNTAATVFSLMQLAEDLGVSVVSLMQHTYVVGGKVGYSAAFMLARCNASKRFKGGVQFKTTGTAGKDLRTVAWAVNAETGEVIEAPPITWAMATGEGWTSNKKYQSMPEVMFYWRAATLFARLYCSDLLFGATTSAEELETDVLDVTPPLALAEPPKPTKAADRAAALASKPVEVIEAKVEPEPAPVEVAPVRQPTEKEARIALYAEAKRHVAAGADEPFIRAFLAESTLVSAKGINDACAELFPKSRPAPADDEP